MSRIKVDDIQGTSGTNSAITLSGANSTINGTLAVTGVHTVGNNAIYTSDGTAVTQNLVQSLVKVWWSIDGTGTAEFRDSFNTSSLTDNGTGDYTSNFSNNLSSANYSSGSQGRRDPSVADNANVQTNMGEAAPTSSSMRQDCSRADFASSEDVDRCNAMIAGDLA